MPADPVRVSPMVPKGWWRSWRRTWHLWTTLVGVVLTLANVWVTDPGNRLWCVIAAGLLAGSIAFWADRSTWLDPAGGAVRQRVLHLYWVVIPWPEVTKLQFRDNALGLVLLQVRGRGWSSIHLPVVALDSWGARSQPLPLLWQLVDEIERWAPEQSTVIAELHAQAAHLEAGGRVLTSPLLRSYSVHARR